MNQRFWIFVAPFCLACAACSGTADSSPDTTGAGTSQTAQQQNSDATPASPVAWDASDVLLAQSTLREEFDAWDRDASDESKPLQERQAALNSLAVHAMQVAEIEKKPWGTVRNQLIDQESARVLRRLATSADKAEIRAQAIETLGQLQDVDGMEALLAGLEHESREVRTAALGAVRNVLSTDFGFRPDDTPEQRAKAIARARAFWSHCPPDSRFVRGLRNPALLKRWKQAARWREDDER